MCQSRSLFIADFSKISGGIPLNRYKKGIASLLVICAFALTACSSNNQPQQNDVSNITQSVETVIAQRGSLTPTLSMQTTVIQASAFALSSPINGAFETQLDVGDKLIAGDVIGNIDGNEIKVPVDGIILSLTPSGENVPKNYPVAIVSYTGFALNVEAENYLKTLDVGYKISDYCYDAENNRLIMALNDVIQFAYLDLDGII